MTDPVYLQLDVFADHIGGGNPLGVVLGAEGWDSAAMQGFACWTNLVETTFVLPPTDPKADYRLRIFTPTREIPFAGHPSIGSAHAALDFGGVIAHGGRLVQECGAGLLPLRVEGEGQTRRLFVQAPPSRVLHTGLDEPLLRHVLGGLALGKLPPAFVEGGRRWWVAEFASEAGLRDWHPDHAAILALARGSDCLGLCAFARCPGPDYEVVVRAFPAGVGIVEDPASGAANGLLGAYLAWQEPDGPLARGYRVSQGREMGRDARIRIRIEGDAIWVGGRTQTVVVGTTRWASGRTATGA
ncbi:MAG: PhzF family phenazine biosynthesis protein [Proteobacteria bacterium]|nr:PhzF family phenazine biosynthesis protein [Pseudomonadota bacterium]